MKIGLLGAGRIGAVHFESLVANESVSSIKVYDLDADRARFLASSGGMGVAEGVDSLMSWADALVIATSTDTHSGLLVSASRAEKPAFCEKPIALDLASTDRAIEAIQAAGIPVQIGFNRRFDNGFRAAQRAMAEGRLGTLLSVVGHHHDHTPPPDHYIPSSGGQFRDQLIHDFDSLRFVTGDEVVKLHASGTSVGLPSFAAHEDHTSTVVTLWLASGALAALIGVRTDPVGYDVRLELFGTKDSIVAGHDRHTPLNSTEPGMSPVEDPYREILSRFGDSYRAEIDAFLSVAAGTTTSRCTPEDARAALVLAEAADLSAREDRIVALDEIE